MSTEQRPFIPGWRHRHQFGSDTPMLTHARGERPLARVAAYRRSEYATVAVHRDGHIRRYRVSLQRYAALRKKTMRMGSPARRSGGWMRYGFVVCFWPESRSGKEARQ